MIRPDKLYLVYIFAAVILGLCLWAVSAHAETCPVGQIEEQVVITPEIPAVPAVPAFDSYDLVTHNHGNYDFIPGTGYFHVGFGHGDYIKTHHNATPAIPGTPAVYGSQCVTDPNYVPPVVDVCPNIEGTQETIPSGYHDEAGQCVIDPVTPPEEPPVVVPPTPEPVPPVVTSAPTPKGIPTSRPPGGSKHACGYFGTCMNPNSGQLQVVFNQNKAQFLYLVNLLKSLGIIK